ncbi:transcriptional regulator [Halobiforma lacisalsi AJ5]|uniref:Bacterio-opsin activator-like protein n=1 Tax=Natronobacterium lacisalsi AJ5 TaxID=358396 RepID=M0LWJ0_NATLA|nr:helix-turn-helix domain-containing protein [Halobiforma lacisalsi]APW97758.1 transcriptional regulator [Halobiforma lacisalsi AJ5]EMA37498.1 bacterio-opsin activator-like protein [Halobiforma lacisalsi AJ5]
MTQNAPPESDDDHGRGSGIRFTLEVWHPDCWTLEVTEATDASLIAHTVYNENGHVVKGHFTAYGETEASIDDLVAATRASALTDSVSVMERRHGGDRRGPVRGKPTTELFVEYDSRNTISDALLAGGFYQEAPVRIQGGREYWPLFFETDDRELLADRLDALRDEYDAEITVRRVHSDNRSAINVSHRTDSLSQRQREIFDLACEQGYYSWPREVTTRELADEADISKTTLLEHLRKAESKLLDPTD